MSLGNPLTLGGFAVQQARAKKEIVMKFQLAKLYRGERFMGYGIAVNGQLLDNQVSTVIDTQSNGLPTVTAVFNLDKNHAESQITIDLRNGEPCQR